MTDDDTRGTHERVRAATTDTGTTPTMRRRALLATGATSLAAIAGCLDSGSDGDGANGGDDAAGNTTGTDPGDDGGNGSESPGNESADPGDDGEQEEPEPEPAPGPEALALEALVIGDGNTAQTRVATGTAVPATVAVTNTAEANVDGELVVRRDGSEVARESVTVSPGSTHDRTIDDVLGDVGTGTYDVTVAIAETDAAASGSVEVTDATDLTVTVRLADADGPPGGGGEVWAFPDEVPVSADTLATTGTGLEARELIDPFDRADIGADGTATVRAPADVDRAGLVVVAPGGGVFPPTDATVEIGAGVEQSVELVAGYPTQGADSFRFATYYYEPPAFREWFVWGTHAATDNQFTRWTDPGIRKETDRFGSVTEKISTFERDDRIHEWGDDLS